MNMGEDTQENRRCLREMKMCEGTQGRWRSYSTCPFRVCILRAWRHTSWLSFTHGWHKEGFGGCIYYVGSDVLVFERRKTFNCIYVPLVIALKRLNGAEPGEKMSKVSWVNIRANDSVSYAQRSVHNAARCSILREFKNRRYAMIRWRE